MNPLPTHTRKTLALPDALWVEIARYRHGRCIGTEVEAVRRLIDAGLKAESQRTRRKGKEGKRGMGLVARTETWDAFVAAAKAYAVHLDQWDKVRFQTEYGLVYVTIGRSDPYPDSFDEV